MAALDLHERVDLYTDYLDNGGYRKLWDRRLIEDLMKVKKLESGLIDVKTVSPIVNAAMLAYEAVQMTGPMVSEKYMGEYETLYQKSGFFRQTTIEIEKDFDKIYDEFKDKKDTLFRGLSEAKYRLYSSLQRNWISNKIYEKGKSYEAFLRELVENAKKANGGVLKVYLEKTGLSPENDIGILSFLQHYGCPTPLLDWTYNFSIALFFGTKNNATLVNGRKINDYFCVYYLEEEHLKDSSLKDIVKIGLTDNQREIKPKVIQNIYEEFRLNGFTDDQIQQACTDEFVNHVALTHYGSDVLNFLTRIEHIIKSPILYFSDSKANKYLQYCLQNNMNIVNQEGVFTWNADPITPLEQIANEQYQTDDDSVNYKFSKCININKSLIPYIQEKLNSCGIVESFIFPNPEDISKSAFKDTLGNS